MPQVFTPMAPELESMIDKATIKINQKLLSDIHWISVALQGAIDADAMQANMDATDGAVLAERATFLLAATMGKQKAGALVEKALAQSAVGGGSFVEALGQLKAELSDEAALLGYSPQFVDRLLADIKRK